MPQFLTASPEIDVDEIMAAVQRRIEERRQAGAVRDEEIRDIEAMELQPMPDFQDIPDGLGADLYPECARPHHVLEEVHETGAAKRAMGLVRRVLFPMIRFFSRPLYMELKRETVDSANRLIDITPVVNHSREYIRLLHHVTNNAVVAITRMKVEQEMLKTRVRVLEEKMEFLENRERALEKRLTPP
jgi:hypothetical protein